MPLTDLSVFFLTATAVARVKNTPASPSEDIDTSQCTGRICMAADTQRCSNVQSLSTTGDNNGTAYVGATVKLSSAVSATVSMITQISSAATFYTAQHFMTSCCGQDPSTAAFAAAVVVLLPCCCIVICCHQTADW